MYIIQVRGSYETSYGTDFGWIDSVDGFDSFQEAKDYALTSIVDATEEEYGGMWRIICDQGDADDCIPTGYGNDAEDFHSDG
jgi:hypothetical protein